MSIDLDAIEQRANAATPGPWEIYRYSTGGGRLHISGDDGRPRELIADTEREPDVATVYNERDREFLYHAREDIPNLIRELREARSRLDTVREWATGWHGGTKRPIDVWPKLADALGESAGSAESPAGTVSGQ